MLLALACLAWVFPDCESSLTICQIEQSYGILTHWNAVLHFKILHETFKGKKKNKKKSKNNWPGVMDGFVDDLHFTHEFTSVSYYGYVCYDCGYNADTIVSK